ncbi:hypothetical protein HYE11_03875 [Mycoplasmopsis bovis]|nr:hypothetical protein HYE11_03875 [Mycoplasmopsis bovis]
MVKPKKKKKETEGDQKPGEIKTGKKNRRKTDKAKIQVEIKTLEQTKHRGK